jgi:hypothetical protein
MEELGCSFEVEVVVRAAAATHWAFPRGADAVAPRVEGRDEEHTAIDAAVEAARGTLIVLLDAELGCRPADICELAELPCEARRPERLRRKPVVLGRLLRGLAGLVLQRSGRAVAAARGPRAHAYLSHLVAQGRGAGARQHP